LVAARPVELAHLAAGHAGRADRRLDLDWHDLRRAADGRIAEARAAASHNPKIGKRAGRTDRPAFVPSSPLTSGRDQPRSPWRTGAGGIGW
jgi:hypothetical protein